MLITSLAPILYCPFKELYFYNHCMVSWWTDGSEKTLIGCWKNGNACYVLVNILWNYCLWQSGKQYSWLGLVSFKAEFENVSWLLLAFFDKVVQERDGLREESLSTDSDRYREPRDSGTLRVENETASNHFKVWALKHSLRTETKSRAQPLRQNLRANKCRSLC